MDVLSEVLRVVRLEGALFFNGEFFAPWCLSTEPTSIAKYLSPLNGQLIIYHFVTEGRAYAEFQGRREELSAGDVIAADAGALTVIVAAAVVVVKPLSSVARAVRA